MKRLALVSVAGIAWAGLAGWAAFETFDRHFPPPLEQATNLSPQVLDREGKILRIFTNDQGRWRLSADMTRIDPRLVAMIIAYEDKRFWRHGGIDLLALARAAGQLVVNGRIVSGGSTISMQLARLIEPRARRSLGAKMRQIVRAWQIERRLSKPEILTLYLTLASYGGNIEGVRAATLAYFGKSPALLSPAQAALLVALPQAPEARRPDRKPKAARHARNRVLDRMARAGVLEPRESAAAKLRPVPARRAMPSLAAHLAQNAVKRFAGAGQITTTLRAPLQRRLEALARRAAGALGARASVAIVVSDHATGEILAQVGSPGYLDSARQGAIDMANALRSPGSTLKPLIYGLAFETGRAHPQTLIEDRPASFAGYTPRNFDFTYQGTVTMREALEKSLNIPAVLVLDMVGPARFMARLARAGVAARLPGDAPAGLAVGLGGLGITLKQLVGLYAGIARGGQAVALTWQPQAKPGPGTATQFLEPAAAWYVTDILRGTPPPTAAAPGRIAYKTGTSYGYRDAWAIGYDGRTVIGVWAGLASGAPVSGLSGRRSAAPILFDAFARLNTPPAAFRNAPPGARITDTAGLPAPLRHFTNPHRPDAAQASAKLEIIFPPTNAQIDLGRPARDARDDPDANLPTLALKARGGKLPLAWYANGKPISAPSKRRNAQWLPDGPGFATLSVVDAAGGSAQSKIFLQ
ncbi:MAG: penicillin-binding protein 1C [Alphaproteobacteria bacterium]